MPFSSIPPELLEKGLWGFLGVCFAAGATILVGWLGIDAKKKIASQENLTQRENLFIEHLQSEMQRLKDQVAELQREYHSVQKSRDDERQAHMVEIAGLKAEITMLKQRMTSEEGR